MKHKCKQCGKEFEKKTEWQKFCSVKCRTAYHNIKSKETECPNCGFIFNKDKE